MEDLDRAIAAVLAVRDCPAARRVCLDVWALALREGEAAGLALAAVVLGAVREYHARSPDGWRASSATPPPGEVLGTRSPPPDAGYWWLGESQLKTRLKPLMGWHEPGSPAPAPAAYWAADATGWWRIATAEPTEKAA